MEINDKEYFAECIEKIKRNGRVQNGIGTMGEKTLHAVLKMYFERHIENHETKIGDFVADIVGANGIIEIQTRAFERLHKKLGEFLEYTHVTVVYPISVKNTICSVREDGTISRRTSPLHGNIYTVFDELYKISDYVANKNFSLCLMMLETEEYRMPVSRKVSRKGFKRIERMPVKLVDEIHLDSYRDYRMFIPDSIEAEFTAKDFATAANLEKYQAWSTLNTLCKAGFADNSKREGKSFVYTLHI